MYTRHGFVYRFFREIIIRTVFGQWRDTNCKVNFTDFLGKGLKLIGYYFYFLKKLTFFFVFNYSPVRNLQQFAYTYRNLLIVVESSFVHGWYLLFTIGIVLVSITCAWIDTMNGHESWKNKGFLWYNQILSPWFKFSLTFLSLNATKYSLSITWHFTNFFGW